MHSLFVLWRTSPLERDAPTVPTALALILPSFTGAIAVEIKKHHHARLNTSEIARRVKLPRTTVHDHIKGLGE